MTASMKIVCAALLASVASTAAAAQVNGDYYVNGFNDPNAGIVVDTHLQMTSTGEYQMLDPNGEVIICYDNITAAEVLWLPINHVLLRDVTRIEATYKGTIGHIAGGSPRYYIGLDLNGNGAYDCYFDPNLQTWVQEDQHVFAYWGSGVPPYVEDFSGDWETTGNVITDTATRWEASQLTGSWEALTFAQILDTLYDGVNAIGDLQVMSIGIALDSSWAQDEDIILEPEGDDLLQMLVDYVNFEGVTYQPGGLSLPGGMDAPEGTPFAEVLVIVVPAPPALGLGLAALCALMRRRR